MSDVAIHVENLSKRYYIGQKQKHQTLRDALTAAFVAPLRRAGRLLLGQASGAAELDETIWALKDVSFEVERGEVMGIIGRNGAGKSTLLKILSRITEPTAGLIEIHGRVGSLLEVGTGFHPELTGRENIYLNGAILGMKRVEIERRFDEIVAFSEVEKFIDTPVKHYSSGMYLRLAFAVAAHLEPEILLVDEVLAVGDAAFQKKCLGKMGDVAREGRTVLFVSHNMVAVQKLCRRAIWLHDGAIVEDDEPLQVVSNYLQTSFSALSEQVWDDIETAPGNDKVRLRCARVRPENGAASDVITVRTPFVMEFEYWNLQPDAYLNLSLHVYSEQGTIVFNTTSSREPAWQGRAFPAGLFRSVCHVPGDLLNNGLHRVELLVVQDRGRIIHRQDDTLMFEVRDAPEMRGEWHGRIPGAVRPNLEWNTQLVETAEPHMAQLAAQELRQVVDVSTER